jgi:hypothetical protein
MIGITNMRYGYYKDKYSKELLIIGLIECILIVYLMVD